MMESGFVGTDGERLEVMDRLMLRQEGENDQRCVSAAEESGVGGFGRLPMTQGKAFDPNPILKR
jgi:hypothetical protein